MELQQDFERIRQLIRRGQARALHAANSEQLKVYWQVGAHVYYRLQASEWGAKTVEQLVAWLKEKEPNLKGFDRRSLYRMKEFYLVWHRLDWDALRQDGSMREISENKIQEAVNHGDIIVGTLSPQIMEFPNALSPLNWSHHIEILSATRNIEERVFYLLLAIKERYTLRELRRQLSSALFERQKLSRQQLAGNRHPGAELISQIFRDKYIFEFLELPEPYSEDDLQKGLVRRLKQFILEIGRDFTFIGEEYRIQVGMTDHFLDLLFFHRELHCLVVFELKVVPFQPEFLGKLNFYLEMLDREVKKSYENPSIGVLLCTAKNNEVVEIALSRNLSPTLIAEYETKLIDRDLLQRMLHEWMEDMSMPQDIGI